MYRINYDTNNEFQDKKKVDIPDVDLPKVKVRSLNPLVKGKRLI